MKTQLLIPLLFAIPCSGCLGEELVSGVADEAPVVSMLRNSDEPANDPALGQNSKTRTLFRSPRLSAHATAGRGSIAAHYHADHEETVYVIAGHARLRLGDEWHDLKRGDLIHIPRGMVHQVEMEESVSAISLFAPPYFGEDRIFVEPGAEPIERETASHLGSPLDAGAIRTTGPGFLFLPASPSDYSSGLQRDT